MIETPEQLAQAIEQMGRMQRILESYRNEILSCNPRNFAILAEGPLEQLRAHIAGLLKDRKSEQDKAVLIEGKDDLTFQRDTEIMFAVQQAGGVLVMQEDK